MARTRDVIVLLPGIMGSRLRKNGTTVWGLGARSLGSMLISRGGSVTEALLLEDDDLDAEELDDGVVADALLSDLHLIPGVWKIDGYSKVSAEIQALFGARLGENFFPFPYDWRRYNESSARRLQARSGGWLRAWRERGNTEAKLILVAHSMGGLVARYFLEVLGGWQDTRALITFGTPFRGSLNAVDALANGVRKGPMGLVKLTELSRSLNSLYQLLPTFEAYDDGSGVLQRVGEIQGVPNIDPARAADALRFHRTMLDAARENERDPAYQAARYVMKPVVGIRQKTNQSGRVDGGKVTMLPSRRGEDPRGDGTVPRMSATPPERGNERLELFASTKHGSLQNADAVLVDLEGLITGFEFDQDHWLAGAGIADLSLDVDDLYFESEPIRVVVEASIETSLELEASVTDTTTGVVVRMVPLTADGEGGFTCEIPPLVEGAYELTVRGGGAMPVADSFAVAETVATPA
jgi:pimeloyl-ACP methyl ester carboxylesterase